ncbi:addiction module toxin, RelE/StbE family [Marinobacter sp. LV10R510-11A]|uniref:type II toxin-antitoxin system RelE/ParE family toxin n=1 Tax=Marinobacter sp. LV10R510-11A TaxID=1415568 RepID=UPI000BC08100|nr:type II toxin-antitoxin system RelE/ParE family toxin [Marinobacter sp. LV10R510-11A]SOB74614.1 addiction module toxin, RelE/StbE family [Marinobacter sp. LV10R510-11A]
MRLKWTDLADIDLEKIEAYIANENSSLVAIDVVMDIIDSVYLILPDHPGAGRQGRLKSTRELVIDGLPFIVIYREDTRANCIQILRVLHMTSSSGRQSE